MKLLSNFIAKSDRLLRSNRPKELLSWSLILFCVAVVVGFFAAWVTHIVASIGLITAGTVLAGVALLLFGLVVFPVGIIHGVGIWFGLF